MSENKPERRTRKVVKAKLQAAMAMYREQKAAQGPKKGVVRISNKVVPKT